MPLPARDGKRLFPEHPQRLMAGRGNDRAGFPPKTCPQSKTVKTEQSTNQSTRVALDGGALNTTALRGDSASVGSSRDTAWQH